MSDLLKKVESETAEEEAQPKAKPAETKLPKEVHELPDRFEALLKEWNTFRDTVIKTIEPLRKLVPEEKVPCPGCGAEIPKSKLPEVEDRLKKEYGRVEHVVVPKEVEKRIEVPKPEVPLDVFRETALSAFPERPDEEAVRAINRLAEEGLKRGWLKSS
jgi:hypothetical protein